MTDFVNVDVLGHFGKRLVGGDEDLAFVLGQMLRLALEREAVVATAYEPGRVVRLFADPRLRRALVRIWEDEVWHECYFRGLEQSPFRGRLLSMMGRLGGAVGAITANASEQWWRRIAAEMAQDTAVAMGKMTRSVRRGMKPAGVPEYCAVNTALEATAYVTYRIMADLLRRVASQSGKTTRRVALETGKRRWQTELPQNVMRIGAQELEHAEVFTAFAHELSGGVGNPGHMRFGAEIVDLRSSIVTRPLADQPPSPRTDESVEAALDAYAPALENHLDVQAGRRLSICIQCNSKLERDRHGRNWRDVGEVVAWCAQFCEAHSAIGEVRILDTLTLALKPRHELVLLNVQRLAGTDPMSALRAGNVVESRTRPRVLREGGVLRTANPEVQHVAYAGWTDADLRLAVTDCRSAPPGFIVEGMRSLVATSLQMSRAPQVFDGGMRDLPRLRDLGVFRLLSSAAPHISLARVTLPAGGERVVHGTDPLLLDRLVAVMVGRNPRSHLYVIAELCS